MNQIEPNVQQTAQFDIELISDYFTFPLAMDKLGNIWSVNSAVVAYKFGEVSREMMQDFVNSANDVYFDIIDGKHDTNLMQIESNSYELFEQDIVIWCKYSEIMIIGRRGKYRDYTNADEIYTNIGHFLTYCCNCAKFDVDLLK